MKNAVSSDINARKGGECKIIFYESVPRAYNPTKMQYTRVGIDFVPGKKNDHMLCGTKFQEFPAISRIVNYRWREKSTT